MSTDKGKLSNPLGKHPSQTCKCPPVALKAQPVKALTSPPQNDSPPRPPGCTSPGTPKCKQRRMQTTATIHPMLTEPLALLPWRQCLQASRQRVKAPGACQRPGLSPSPNIPRSRSRQAEAPVGAQRLRTSCQQVRDARAFALALYPTLIGSPTSGSSAERSICERAASRLRRAR